MNLTLCATGRSDAHLHAFGQHLLHRDVLTDFDRLQRHARNDGVHLEIASSFRSFERQALIWNNKYTGQRPVYDHHQRAVDLQALSALERIEAIMLFSALPGASRHHFGTDMDVWDPNAVDAHYNLQLNEQEYAHSGPFALLTQWLDEHMAEYGFFRPYHRYQGGVAAEPWHISHHPSAKTMQQYQSINSIADAISHAQVEGKDEILANLEALYQHYVVNICEPF